MGANGTCQKKMNNAFSLFTRHSHTSLHSHTVLFGSPGRGQKNLLNQLAVSSWSARTADLTVWIQMPNTPRTVRCSLQNGTASVSRLRQPARAAWHNSIQLGGRRRAAAVKRKHFRTCESTLTAASTALSTRNLCRAATRQDGLKQIYQPLESRRGRICTIGFNHQGNESTPATASCATLIERSSSATLAPTDTISPCSLVVRLDTTVCSCTAGRNFAEDQHITVCTYITAL